jgi:hypothetical protein
MQAMDAELERLKKSQGKQKVQPTPQKGKGKEKQKVIIDIDNIADEDIESAMHSELLEALGRDIEDDDEEGIDESTDYNLIKNFLESFKSQAGLSGPVSNLAGRLQPGWKLPRDL